METQSLHYFPDPTKENISITQYYSIISIKRHLIIILLHCQLLNNRNSDQCHTAVSKSISIQACKSAFMNSDTKASSHMQCQVLHNTLTELLFMTLTEQYHIAPHKSVSIHGQICHFVCKLCCTLFYLCRSQPPSCMKRQ